MCSWSGRRGEAPVVWRVPHTVVLWVKGQDVFIALSLMRCVQLDVKVCQLSVGVKGNAQQGDAECRSRISDDLHCGAFITHRPEAQTLAARTNT